MTVALYVLAVSQKAVRLFECSRNHVQELELPGVPQGMEGAVPEGPAPQLQRHTLPVDGRSAARFHGHGIGTDDVNIFNLTRYFHRVDDGLDNFLKDQKIPLMLACVDYLAPIFREVSRYPHVVDEIIPGNPDGVSSEELRQKGWAIVEPHFRKVREQDAAQ